MVEGRDIMDFQLVEQSNGLWQFRPVSGPPGLVVTDVE